MAVRSESTLFLRDWGKLKNIKKEWNMFDCSRRNFLTGSLCAVAAPCIAEVAGSPRVDANLSAFLSDLHVSGWNVKGQPTYQNPLFEKVVDQVLALNPRPARVVVFGDLALWNGLDADYEVSLPGLKRLTDAGMDLYVTAGNHDCRERMFKYHLRQKELTPVPGRFVSVIDLGHADLFLLDSLHEIPRPEGFGSAIQGIIDPEQGEWLVKKVASATRPYFLGAHHPPGELKIKGKDIRGLFAKDPKFAGFIHGHSHRWDRQWYHKDYVRKHVIRQVGLPSTGWWGNIGFATMRTFPGRAELKFVQNDFFFPHPVAEGETRPSEWDEIVRENANTWCTFTWG